MHKKSLRFLHLSWDEVQRLSEMAAEKIRSSGFKPDLILAVGRGGFAPARIFCDQLSINRLASLQIEYYSGVDQKLEDANVVYPLNADVQGLKVLVVDDVSDSGSSLRFIRDYILQRGASDVKIATLHIKPWTNFKPDYYAEEVDAWIVYPWEVLETAKSLVQDLRGSGLEEVAVERRLLELGFSREVLRRLDPGVHSKM